MGFVQIPSNQTCRLTTSSCTSNQNIQTTITAMTIFPIYPSRTFLDQMNEWRRAYHKEHWLQRQWSDTAYPEYGHPLGRLIFSLEIPHYHHHKNHTNPLSRYLPHKELLGRRTTTTTSTTASTTTSTTSTGIFICNLKDIIINIITMADQGTPSRIFTGTNGWESCHTIHNHRLITIWWMGIDFINSSIN